MDDKYLIAWLEEMKDSINLVLEGHAVLDNKIEALSRNTASLSRFSSCPSWSKNHCSRCFPLPTVFFV